jgi:ferredoxin
MVRRGAVLVSPVEIVVDSDLCEGHALCVTAAPDVFEIGDDEKAFVLPVELTDEVLKRVDDAILHCPVQAISRCG